MLHIILLNPFINTNPTKTLLFKSFKAYVCFFNNFTAGTSLRTSWGLEYDNFCRLFSDLSLDDLVIDDEKCQQFIQDGLLIISSDSLRLSEKGLALADFITPYVLHNLNRKIL